MAVSTPSPIRDPNYYLREQTLEPPTWKGNASRILGIHGQEIDQATYLNLFDGYTTKDGQRDVKLPRYMHPERRGGFDITVTLPKSASIMGEVGGDSRVLDVLKGSIHAVEKEIERQAWTRCPWERNSNLVMTDIIHGGSRADDPHLHGHIVVMNLSHSSKGWKAIELGQNVDWKQVGEVSRDVQMKGLRQLGYKVQRSGAEFEVVGVPAEVKAKFSRRHEAIKEQETQFEQLKGAPLTPRAKSRLSVYNRPEKPDDRPLEARRAEWVSSLTDSEHSQIRGVVSRARATVRRDRWRHESRAAYDRLRPIEQAPEIERGYGRSR